MIKSWDEGLSDDQIRAATHRGSHARLLAGPGTGKTMTLARRVFWLITQCRVHPSRILAVTFTRVAAHQFREELRGVLKPLGLDLPRISTLHSFALRQLLRNSERIDALPKPLRIADDWEERYIIEEDLKRALGKHNVRKIRELLDQLSADWETLKYEDYEKSGQGTAFPDPKFLGAWREHREVFGYTLRAELVYQLKRALNQYPDFGLESGYSYVLIDEYQDLNACDLAVVKELANRGVELFVAGDDDQSIYGFRYASPDGIRNFSRIYPNARELALEICFRCDRSILDLAEFVANLDTKRLPKSTRAMDSAGPGEVHIQCYRDQFHEANEVGRICKRLIEGEHVDPSQILILIRSDHQRKISTTLLAALKSAGIPVAERTEEGPLETKQGRLVLATLRLLYDPRDSLAWRTILQLEPGIGSGTLDAVREYAQNQGRRFALSLQDICDDPSVLPHFGKRVAERVCYIQDKLARLEGSVLPLPSLVEKIAGSLIEDAEERSTVVNYLKNLMIETNSESLADFVQALGVSLDMAEQELVPGSVNILTMHKAKGLNADTVIIVGAEDETIPGKNLGIREGDERRLLYVSMTRAKHRLFITYCQQRTGEQRFTGRNSGNPKRTLTRFLRDAPIQVEHC